MGGRGGGGGGGGGCPLLADSTSGKGRWGAVHFRLIQTAGWGSVCLLSADSTSEGGGGGGVLSVCFRLIQPVKGGRGVLLPAFG